VAIAWVLRHDVVSSAIVGATSVAQLEQNLRALEVKLSPAEWREVESAIAGRRAGAARKAGGGRGAAKRKR
jgi:L-glyceraldehyde 3-phosphate reductase